MGMIHIEGMEFFAYHGHYKEEQIVGNKFLVDLEIETDLKKAAETDSLKDALNYQEAYNIVREEMKAVSNLLENIAKRILDSLYAKFGDSIVSSEVKVSKLNPQMGGRIKAVAVSMKR